MVGDLNTFKRVSAAFCALFCLFSSAAIADVLRLPNASATNTAENKPLILPTSGMSMAEVQQQWGQPLTKHPTVSQHGGKLQPPITRWDYASFTVVFEHDKVIQSVNPNNPPVVVR